VSRLRGSRVIAQAEGTLVRSWSPLLSGANAQAARAAAEDIGYDLARWPFPCSPSTWPQVPGGAWSLGLPAGRAGRALFYAYLAAATRDSRAPWLRLAQRLIGEALDGLVAVADVDGFYFGLPGILWAAGHVPAEPRSRKRLAGALRRADQRLARLVAGETWLGPYDLTAGLVGVGLYFLERLPEPGAAAGLDDVLRLLDRAAHRSDTGAAWFTPPHLLAADEHELFPQGCYKVALAHGGLGIAAFLARACAAGHGGANARDLLGEAVRWLLAHREADERGSHFPTLVAPDGARVAAKMPWAWCQGDLGAAAALLSVAECTGDRLLAERATNIAVALARRLEKADGPPSPGLCHGAAGVGHLFNRLYQATLHPEIGRAAIRWVERTLAFRRPGRTIGGFSLPISQLEPDGAAVVRADGALLTGAAGIGLTLLAASSSCAPEWDRMLLVSPGRRAPGPALSG
jgi:class I lanthipeptide synthase